LGKSRCSGFTLIEILVALAIVAIALAAASRAVAVSTVSATEVKLRVLAGFVAENRMSELAAHGTWPAIGVLEGAERQAGVEFPWRIEVLSTPHPLFRRVEIRVSSPGDPSRELRRLIGVLPRETGK
jgi:general secretion pathway protein I